ncbi:hypothetical protein PSTG_11668 [Puccinia striiformis f. sp. tritici PST-78]|uniref:Uncharacterized protein n=1 Tax=Puccinia striiformis f. sp. tritici PST-78 TaxID=1165861 RepID=A0A0L0V7M5_9BASI|nr:hypothetical protein PSTG_11668 [Puccinia striiformis f. sp. tritici PST-78]
MVTNNKNRQHTLNRTQLKSLTENLRLRLKYAKLKVINGWHNRTLNEIETTFSSVTTRTTTATTTSTSQAKPASSSASLPELNKQNRETEESQQQAQIMIRPSTTTLFNLPSKYSTPFRKIIRTGGPGELMTNESNIFWPTGPMTSSSSTGGSPSSSTRFNRSTNSLHKQHRNNSLENGLFFKFGSKANNTIERIKKDESEDLLFKDPMDDYRDFYKQSSPASFLFNNQYRPLLGTSSSNSKSTTTSKVGPTPSRSFFNHPIDILNSISPVRIRSHLHSDLHNPNHHSQSTSNPSLLKLAASTIVSPSPNRTQSNLSKIFGSGSKDRDISTEIDLVNEDHQKQHDLSSSTNTTTTTTTTTSTNKTSSSSSSSSPSSCSSSSPIKFTINPTPTNPKHSINLTTTSSDQTNHSQVGPDENGAGILDHIGLDELDQLNWE